MNLERPASEPAKRRVATRFLAGALLAAGLCGDGIRPLQAQAVFKCRTPEGLSYQDVPCAAGTDLPAPQLAPPPAYVPPPEPLTSPKQASAELQDEAPRFRPVPPPITPMYRCTDAVSGKSYVSAMPDSNPRYVPLWTVMPSGTSAGGLSADLPTQGRLPAGTLGSYTEVRDRCRQMPVAELCGYWRQRLDEVSGKRRLAFNDTRSQLEQEEAGLNEMLAGYCER